MDKNKKLGIIGGMGSVAAAYFFNRLVELTPVERDQDYIETFLHNNSQIPDRTEGIIYGGASPLPETKRSVALLNTLGADFIIIACLTSHYFIPELQKDSHAVILDAVQETAQFVKEKMPALRKIGLIASTGLIRVSLFQKAFDNYGINTLTLNDRDQDRYFTQPIYEKWGIKAGNITGRPRKCLIKAAQILIDSGAEAIVAGCSELPLVLSQKYVSVPLVDSIDILLQAAITNCLFSKDTPQ